MKYDRYLQNSSARCSHRCTWRPVIGFLKIVGSGGVSKFMCEYHIYSHLFFRLMLRFNNKAVSDGAISSYLDHIVKTRASRVTFESSASSTYDLSNLEHVKCEGVVPTSHCLERTVLKNYSNIR